MLSSVVRRIVFAAAAALALPALAHAEVFPGVDGAPSIEIAVPMNGFGYPQGAEVIAGYGCWSEIIDVIVCEGTTPLGSPVDTQTAGVHTFTVHAVDFEGRESTAIATYTVFDITPPFVEFRTPSHLGEYGLGDEVFVDYRCVDNPGGVGVAYCEGTQPRGAPLDTSRVGTFELRVDAIDEAGNHDAATSMYRVVDRNTPTVTITSPADGASYVLGAEVEAAYACYDPPPGVLVFCAGDVPIGSPADTTTVGLHTFRVTALDSGRNEGHATSTYSVVYDFDGFFAPVASLEVNSVRAGDVVPVKFSLGGDQGFDVFALGSPSWRPCGAFDRIPASGRLVFHASRYTFRWQTEEAWEGSCRELFVELRDGTTHSARFSFRA